MILCDMIRNDQKGRIRIRSKRPRIRNNTWTEGDRNCLEKVQQRAVKRISGLERNVYDERLRELNLPTLLERRHQADMAMVHKILHERGGLDHTTRFD
jgi:hypothetical protein